MTAPYAEGPSCPVPRQEHARITIAHGGGGRAMHRLIQDVFLRAFGGGAGQHDSAVLDVEAGRVAFTTDSFVVKPLFFPGGCIGKLAVCGTVNDLAMAGARPVALSAGFLLEEGFPIADLERIVAAMQAEARACGAVIAAGDTKVVEHGRGDGVYINTAGIGIVEAPAPIAPSAVRPGDAVLLSGDLGRHGIAVMAEREGLAFETAIESDAASLWAPVSALLAAGAELHCLRDLTRGGLASALNEIAGAAPCGIRVAEAAIPVDEQVSAACELLGLDPLYVANEGRFIAIVPESGAAAALAAMRAAGCPEAVQIGAVESGPAGRVTLEARVGATRILDMLSGEQLPRIC